jgi:hypothetical protein
VCRKNRTKTPVGAAAKHFIVKNKTGGVTARSASETSLPCDTVFEGSKVASYRLYCLDGVGKVVSAQWLDADNDDSAIEAAHKLREGRSCELWQGQKLVARLGEAEGE